MLCKGLVISRVNKTRLKTAEALKYVRQTQVKLPTTEAAVKCGMAYNAYYDREHGRVPIKLHEFVEMCDAWEVDPIQMFVELLEHIDGQGWGKVARKLGVNAAVAKRRFQIAQKQRKLGFKELWLLVENDQVDI